MGLLERQLERLLGWEAIHFCKQCAACSAELPSVSALIEHLVSKHFRGSPFPCVVLGCGEMMLNVRQLCMHLRVHAGEQLHPCERCGRCFSTSSSLRRHERAHARIRMSRCAACGARFLRLAQLYAHERAAHGRVREHACELCERAFSRPTLLKRHVRKAHASQGQQAADGQQDQSDDGQPGQPSDGLHSVNELQGQPHNEHSGQHPPAHQDQDSRSYGDYGQQDREKYYTHGEQLSRLLTGEQFRHTEEQGLQEAAVYDQWGGHDSQYADVNRNDDFASWLEDQWLPSLTGPFYDRQPGRQSGVSNDQHPHGWQQCEPQPVSDHDQQIIEQMQYHLLQSAVPEAPFLPTAPAPPTPPPSPPCNPASPSSSKSKEHQQQPEKRPRGRPRKNQPVAASEKRPRGRPRKNQPVTAPEKRPRGRTEKNQPIAAPEKPPEERPPNNQPVAAPEKRPRGRPRKNQPVAAPEKPPEERPPNTQPVAAPEKRPRGRPRKNQPVAAPGKDQAVQTAKPQWRCAECGARCTTARSLKAHLLQHLKELSEPNPNCGVEPVPPQLDLLM